MGKPTILTFVPVYLPGYKHGGPVRSVSNMVRRLRDRFHFRVVTGDRDDGDDEPYEGVTVDAWTQRRGTDVYYCPPGRQTLRGFYRIVRDTPHDAVYLNGSLEPVFSLRPLLLRRLGLLPERPTLLAARGQFAPQAMRSKALKKNVFLKLARAFGLYEGLHWHATDDEEARELRTIFGRDLDVHVAENLGTAPPEDLDVGSVEKAPGVLRGVFLSRIVPHKNLDFVLEALGDVQGEIHFDIYGPIADRDYWASCQSLIEGLPENVDVNYRGSLTPADVIGTLSSYHLFLLPSRNESFGHTILEALQAGCPVLISDRTPWKDLADEGVGWDVPLEEPRRFRERLQDWVNADESAYRETARRAHDYGERHSARRESVRRSVRMFEQLVGESRRRGGRDRSSGDASV